MIEKLARDFTGQVLLLVFCVPILLFYIALWFFYLKDKKPIYQEN